MDVAKRIKIIRIMDKIQRNQEYANKIGTTNKSEFKNNKREDIGGTKR